MSSEAETPLAFASVSEGLGRWRTLAKIRGSSTPLRSAQNDRNETLLTTPFALDSLRNQHHAPARSRIRVAHHFHDHDAASREQRESCYPVERRGECADQSGAGPDHFDRSPGGYQVQQQAGSNRRAAQSAQGIEANEPGSGGRHSPGSRIAGAEVDDVDGRVAAGADQQSRDRDES